MDVKPGFKQSEVGVIPEEWEVRTLDEFISLQRGHDLTDRDRRRGKIPVMGSAGQNGFHDTAIVKGPGVVLGRSGASFGQAHFCPVDFWPHNTALYVTDFHGHDPLFVFYFLRSIDFSRYNSGGAQQSLNRNYIASIPIAIPPTLTEQQAIAEALSDVDALISVLDRLIGKKRAIKQGAMQELLTGRRRLPAFAANLGYRQTELGAIPNDWQVKRLDALCAMKSGEGITGADIDDHSPFPCYGGNGLRGQAKRYTHQGSYALIGRQGALCGNVLGVEGRFFASEHAIVVTPLPGTDIQWLTLMLGAMNLNQYSESSAQPGLSVTKLSNLPLVCPPTLAEQTAIATILSDMDAEIAALERRRDKTKLLKQGMMQELLTGRTRLV